LKLKKDNRLLH